MLVLGLERLQSRVQARYLVQRRNWPLRVHTHELVRVICLKLTINLQFARQQAALAVLEIELRIVLEQEPTALKFSELTNF